MNVDQLTPDAIMQKVSTGRPYTLLHLITGPTPQPADEALAEELQMGHLAHLFSLEQRGHSCVFGPVVNDPNLVGIVIFKTNDRKEIENLMKDDPYVNGGYLSYKLFEFFTIPGQTIS